MKVEIPDFPNEWYGKYGITGWHQVSGGLFDRVDQRIGALVKWYDQIYLVQVTYQPRDPEIPEHVAHASGYLYLWPNRKLITYYHTKITFLPENRNDALTTWGSQIRDEAQEIFNALIYRSITGEH